MWAIADEGGEPAAEEREPEGEIPELDAASLDPALEDSELDDEIEAFERSLNADWEVRLYLSLAALAFGNGLALLCSLKTGSHLPVTAPS